MIELLNIDCMEYMATQPDKSFDLAIVDPPYGIGEDGRKTATRRGHSKAWRNQKIKEYAAKNWDKEPPNVSYFNELRRVSRHQIIWGANHFISRIPIDTPCWIVWYKAGQNPNTDFADCELAWCSFKKAVKFFKFDWTGFGAVNAKEHRIHPTQKPVALYKWLLEKYAKPDQRILDTHLGSGSSAIAAHYFGCDFVGCEIDVDYYEAAKKRFNDETAQLDMLC